MKETTLCYIEDGSKYLMLHRTKKKNDQSQGKWLGVGGKLEPGESVDECLLRETTEETGLTLTAYQYRAKIYFYSDIYEDEIMHLYTATEFVGKLTECNEGELAWIEKPEVLDMTLWEGDRIFLKKLLEGNAQPFELKLYYEGETLVHVAEGNYHGR